MSVRYGASIQRQLDLNQMRAVKHLRIDGESVDALGQQLSLSNLFSVLRRQPVVPGNHNT
jgi:hypothetical protein